MALAAVPNVGYAATTVITDADFSAASVPLAWSPGAYRRLELRLRITTGSSGNVTVTLAGLTGTYSSWCTYNGSGMSAWGASAFPASWVLGNGDSPGQTDGTFEIAPGAVRSYRAPTLDAGNAYLLLTQGSHTDTTSPVSGMTLTFPVSTTGHLYIAGYR